MIAVSNQTTNTAIPGNCTVNAAIVVFANSPLDEDVEFGLGHPGRLAAVEDVAHPFPPTHKINSGPEL